MPWVTARISSGEEKLRILPQSMLPKNVILSPQAAFSRARSMPALMSISRYASTSHPPRKSSSTGHRFPSEAFTDRAPPALALRAHAATSGTMNSRYADGEMSRRTPAKSPPIPMHSMPRRT